MESEEDMLMMTLRYRIAWAFLKLVDGSWRSSRYSDNIFCLIWKSLVLYLFLLTRFGSRVRLQLYKPSMRSSAEGEAGLRDVWTTWR